MVDELGPDGFESSHDMGGRRVGYEPNFYGALPKHRTVKLHDDREIAELQMQRDQKLIFLQDFLKNPIRAVLHLARAALKAFNELTTQLMQKQRETEQSNGAEPAANDRY